jgi:phenylacetate-CoA ligase
MEKKVRNFILNDVYRRNIKYSVRNLQEKQWDNPEKHYYRQIEKLREILHHVKSVSYYQKYLVEQNVESDPIKALKSIPILEKENIVEHFNSLIHPDIKYRGKGATSGSTGIGLSFLYDNSMLANTETLTRFFRSWYGIDIGDKNLRIWGRPLKGLRNKAHSYFSDLLRGIRTIDPWNLSPENLRNNWEYVFKYKPDFIYGYAVSIASLAKWIKQNNFTSSAQDLRLKVIISTSETLLPSDKQIIKDVFICPVAEEYGAAEVSIIAHQCLDGNFHIASDSLYLETVDDNGDDVGCNTPGHILVTSFVNRAQPLLRYHIGDYGILLSTPCSCGRGMPLLKLKGAKIIEMIKTESGKIFSAEIIDYINLALMKNPKTGIRQFKVIQKDIRTFIVEVVPNKQFNDESKVIFTHLFVEQLGEKGLTVNFDIKDKIEPLPSGKLLYFQSEIL